MPSPSLQHIAFELLLSLVSKHSHKTCAGTNLVLAVLAILCVDVCIVWKAPCKLNCVCVLVAGHGVGGIMMCLWL